MTKNKNKGSMALLTNPVVLILLVGLVGLYFGYIPMGGESQTFAATQAPQVQDVSAIGVTCPSVPALDTDSTAVLSLRPRNIANDSSVDRFGDGSFVNVVCEPLSGGAPITLTALSNADDGTYTTTTLNECDTYNCALLGEDLVSAGAAYTVVMGEGAKLNEEIQYREIDSLAVSGLTDDSYSNISAGGASGDLITGDNSASSDISASDLDIDGGDSVKYFIDFRQFSETASEWRSADSESFIACLSYQETKFDTATRLDFASFTEEAIPAGTLSDNTVVVGDKQHCWRVHGKIDGLTEERATLFVVGKAGQTIDTSDDIEILIGVEAYSEKNDGTGLLYSVEGDDVSQTPKIGLQTWTLNLAA